MNFVEDPGISLRMMWQTYPLFWMILGLLVSVFLFRWMYRKSHWRVITSTDGLKIPYRRKFFIITAILFVIFIYGRLALTPLTWKQCFVFRDSFKSYLALNPLQNFFATLKLRKPDFNEQKAREAFPVNGQSGCNCLIQQIFHIAASFHREAMPLKAGQILCWLCVNHSACIKAA